MTRGTNIVQGEDAIDHVVIRCFINIILLIGARPTPDKVFIFPNEERRKLNCSLILSTPIFCKVCVYSMEPDNEVTLPEF